MCYRFYSRTQLVVYLYHKCYLGPNSDTKANFRVFELKFIFKIGFHQNIRFYINTGIICGLYFFITVVRLNIILITI